MGRKKKTGTPAPFKIEKPIPIVEEQSLIGQKEYMSQREDDRMSVESTILSSPRTPKQTMMSSASNTASEEFPILGLARRKKKKPEVDQTQTMGY